MRWQFEVHDAGPTGCRFILRMSNGQAVLTSDEYGEYASCVLAIRAVKSDASLSRTYVRMRTIDGYYYAVVVNGRNDTIATSPMFKSRAARAAAIVAIRTLAPAAPVVDCRVNSAIHPAAVD